MTDLPATILVVDDAPENLSVLTGLLAPFYQVLASNSGKRAIELAGSHPVPDLILLDVMMPEMDGFAVLTQLQARPVTQKIPVIFVTALDSEDDQQRGLDAGAMDYISKPLQPAIVLARIRIQLELKRARDLMRNQNVFLESEVALRVAEAQQNNLRELAERARAAHDLRESEMRWQFAVESRGDAMWDWDAEHDEMYLTEVAKELFSLPDVGRKRAIAELMAQVHDEDRAQVRAEVDDMMAGKTSEWLGEWRMLSSEGKFRWIVTRGRVMARTPNGQPRRIVSISHDATDRIQREIEDRRQRALLAHQGRLVLLGELASALAHEMNQPLTAMAGFSAAACRRVADQPEILELLRAAEEQAMRAGEIAWRMRNFARRQHLGPVALSLHEVVAGVAKWIHVDESYSNVYVDFAGVRVDLPKVSGEKVELEQVLFNLVRNGIEAQYAPVKDQRIAIAAFLTQEPGTVEVTVTDWGCGLPEDSQFDAFASFTSSKSSGLGLGLTICASIIEGHGGHLWATKNPEGGTVFHFTLQVSEPTDSTSSS